MRNYCTNIGGPNCDTRSLLWQLRNLLRYQRQTPGLLSNVGGFRSEFMPVIRGQVRGPSLTDDQRNALLQKLENELAGSSSSSGLAMWDNPLIFEIPLERLDGTLDRIDVIVVWDAFRNLRSEERTGLILEAYGDRESSISQALGVTHDEMMDQALLPYRMMHMEHPGEVDLHVINNAMLDEGGFMIGNRAELLLPTRRMAEAALARLNERVPNGRWAIGELVR
jgi:hypothetical protein